MVIGTGKKSFGSERRKLFPDSTNELPAEMLDRVVGGAGEVRRPEEGVLDAGMIAAAEASIEQNAAYASFREDRDASEQILNLTQALTTGRLENVRGDVNYHAVQLQAGLTYSFNTTGSGFNAALALYDADGRAVVVNDDSAGSTQAKIDFRVPEGGSATYFLGVAVSGGGASTAEYKINASAVNARSQAVDIAVALDPTSFSVSATEDLLGQRGNAYAGFGSDQNSLQLAPVITGPLTNGTLDSARGDANYHQLQMREGVTYTIDTRGSALANTVLVLLDAKGNAIRIDDDGAGAGKSSLSFTVPAGSEGKYFVGVSSFGGTETGGSYRLNVAANIQGASVDTALALNPDSLFVQRDSDLANAVYAGFSADQNTFQLSPSITSPVTNGSLDREIRDANYHSLQLRAGVTYSFDTSGSGLRDSVLALFDSKGNAIAVNDNAVGLQSAITFTVPAGGDGKYYLGISQNDDRALGGNYRINISAVVQGTPVDAGLALNPQALLIERDARLNQFDYANFGADQNTLQSVSAITAAVTNGVLDRDRGDANYHSLQLRSGITYTFDTIGSGNLDPVIALFDSKGRALVMDDQSAGFNQARFSFTVPSGGDGVYYFGVSSWGGYAGEGTAYRINIGASSQGQAVDTALALNPAAGLLVQRDVDIAGQAFAGFYSDQSTLQSAPPITTGQTNGQLEAQRGDANYHLIQLREGVTYTIDTKGSGIPNTVLALFDANGNAIRVDDDSGGSGKSSITFTVPSGSEGRFYVGISSFAGANIGGSYRINIAASIQGSAVDIGMALNPSSGVLVQRDRDIDTPAYIAFQQDHAGWESAPAIVSASSAGRIDGAADAGYHSIRMIAGNEYRFSVTGIDAAIVLFDASGNAIRADTTGEGHSARLVFKVPADGSGTYRVGVAVAGGGSGATSYVLNTAIQADDGRALDTATFLLAAEAPTRVFAAPVSSGPNVNDGDSVRILGDGLSSNSTLSSFLRDAGSVQVAVPLLGSGVSGRFEPGSMGTNYHSVTLREGWSYSFSSTVTGSGVTLALFDSEGRALPRPDSASGNTPITFQVPQGAAGTYYLGVAGSPGATSEYRVNLSVIRDGSASGTSSLSVDPSVALNLNNFYVQSSGEIASNPIYSSFCSDVGELQRAIPLTGAEITGRIDTVGEAQYRSIQLVPGLTYQFNTSGSAADTVIALFDSRGRAVQVNDDAAGLGNSARISFRVPEDSGGIYYIGVATESGVAQTGEFKLNTSVANDTGQRINVADILALGILAFDDTAGMRGFDSLDIPQRDLNDARQFVVARDTDIDGDTGLHRSFSLDQGERVTATPLVGAGIAGKLGADTADANYHSVRLLPGLTYTFHSGGSSFNTVMALFNEKGEALQTNNDYFGIQDKSLIRFTVPADGAGLYYVGIAAASGQAVADGSYQIRAMAHLDAATAAQATQFREMTGSGSTNRAIVAQDKTIRAAAADLALDASVVMNAHSLRVQPDNDLANARFESFRADASGNLIQLADRISSASSPGTVDARDRTDYRLIELLPGVTYTFNAKASSGTAGIASVLMDEHGRTIATDTSTDPGTVRFTVPDGAGGTYYLGIGRTGTNTASPLAYGLETTALNARTGEFLDVGRAIVLGSQTFSDYLGISSGGGRGSVTQDQNDADSFRVAADADISGSLYAGFRDDQTSVQAATPLLGGTTTGRLDNQQADANYHSVRLLPGITYTFDTRGSSFDTVLALFDQKGRAIAVDDNSGARASIQSTQGESLLRFTVPADGEGTYYLGISSAGGQTAGASYRLNVNAAERMVSGAVTNIDPAIALDPARFIVQNVGVDGRTSSLLSAAPFQSFAEDVRSAQSAPPMTGPFLAGRLETTVRDANYHSIELLPGVTYSFDTKGSGISDPVLALFDRNGRPLAANDDGPSLGLNSRILFTVPADGGGTYYLGVAADPTARAATAPAGLEYKLYSNVVPLEEPASVFAPQSDARLNSPIYSHFKSDIGARQAALEITTPTVTGQLDGVREGVEYRSVEFKAGLTYTINTVGSAFNTTLALFDSQGKLLQINDNVSGLGDKSQVTFRVPDGGEGKYYIGVSTAGHGQAGGNYTLNLTAQNQQNVLVNAAAAISTDYKLIQFDSDIASATFAGFRDDQGTLQTAPLVTESTFSGNLESVRGDANYHALNLRPGYTYQIDTGGSRFNTVLALFDRDGKAIQVNDDAGGALGLASRITFTVPSGAGGEYTIGISSSGGTLTGGAYTLNIAAQDSSGKAVDARVALDPATAAAERAMQYATLFSDDMPVSVAGAATNASQGSASGQSVGFSLLTGYQGEVRAGVATVNYSVSTSASVNAGYSGSMTITADSITITGSVGARIEFRVGANGEVSAGPLRAMGEVELRMVAEALAQGGAHFGKDGMEVSAKLYAGVVTELKARYGVQLTEHLGVGGAGTTSSFIYAVAEAQAAIGERGVEATLGAEVGVGMGVSGEGSFTLAGVTVGAGAGISSGFQAGFSGSGHATYEDGVVSFGLSGDLALLLGVEVDFNIDLDFAAIVDFGEDLTSLDLTGFVSGDVAEFVTQDVADFFSEDVADFFANDVTDFFTQDVGDAFEDFADSFVSWITKPC